MGPKSKTLLAPLDITDCDYIKKCLADKPEFVLFLLRWNMSCRAIYWRIFVERGMQTVSQRKAQSWQCRTLHKLDGISAGFRHVCDIGHRRIMEEWRWIAVQVSEFGWTGKKISLLNFILFNIARFNIMLSWKLYELVYSKGGEDMDVSRN